MLQMDVSADVVGFKSNHEAAGVGPRLGAKITDVGDGDASLFEGFAGYGFFEGFARLDEACHEAEEVAFEILGTHE